MVFSCTYTRRFSEETGAQIVWEKIAEHPFDEMIVSWNAQRPLQGSFRIATSVRGEERDWSKWLPFAEWGKDGQKTFLAKDPDAFVTSYQDTVSLTEGKKASAFRIKVEPLSNASLRSFDALHASLSSLGAFSIQEPSGHLRAVRLALQPIRSQMTLSHPRRRDLCSPTSVSMAIDFLLKKSSTDPVDFASKVLDGGFDIYGNWSLNIGESYQRLGGLYECKVARLLDFSALHSQLEENLPVVVSVKGPLPGAPLPYDQGHLLLVYGFDPLEKRVLCIDPAFPTDESTRTSYDLSSFLAAWGRRKNLAYLFSPK